MQYLVFLIIGFEIMMSIFSITEMIKGSLDSDIAKTILNLFLGVLHITVLCFWINDSFGFIN